MKISKIFRELKKEIKKNNSEIVLSAIENFRGETIEERILENVDGIIYLYELNCYQANDLGLGTCTCKNHETYTKTELTPEEVSQELWEFAKYKKSIL
ncbi:MAG: hypothetical protein PWQ45_131 [Thermosipho sp. (in: thermotogales)]|nr:hypothetical protein [Thermosipho sp. (in: thermotogales)]